jgi:hypothetical protein
MSDIPAPGPWSTNDTTTSAEMGDATIQAPPGGAFGSVFDLLIGPEHREQAQARAAAAETAAQQAWAHAQELHHQELRQARARAFARWTTAVLILAFGIEVLVILPLLVWGLWNGAVIG